MNWPVVDTPEMIARLFVGVGAVGIWDELFFICIVFTLLRRHFPDWQANLLQAIVFVSFLWELGYQAWGPLLTIPFALVQALHLQADAVADLRRHRAPALRRGRVPVLVHAHNPGLLTALPRSDARGSGGAAQEVHRPVG